MRLKRNVRLLESTLRRALARPLLSSQCNRRRFASSSAAYPEQIAVLGGGISGLASAHFVAKEFPNSNITVFESAKEAGGWLRSRRTAVPGGDVVFEYGPRTLRPGLSSVATVQLVSMYNIYGWPSADGSRLQISGSRTMFCSRKAPPPPPKIVTSTIPTA